MFLVNWNMKVGMEKEFKEWAKKNTDIMRKHMAPGWKFWGFYGATMNLGPYDVTEIYEFKKFADIDAARAFEDSEWDRISVEELDFMASWGPSWVLREAQEWMVLETKKRKKK